jgi:hypothetical protein
MVQNVFEAARLQMTQTMFKRKKHSNGTKWSGHGPLLTNNNRRIKHSKWPKNGAGAVSWSQKSTDE